MTSSKQKLSAVLTFIALKEQGRYTSTAVKATGYSRESIRKWCGKTLWDALVGPLNQSSVVHAQDQIHRIPRVEWEAFIHARGSKSANEEAK